MIMRPKTLWRMPWLARELLSGAPRSADKAVLETIRRLGRFRFLQVGANDGVVNDCVHRVFAQLPCDTSAVRGVCVEPQRAAFQSLERLCRDRPGVLCCNVALADKPGHRLMYNIAESCRRARRFGDFGDRLASFDRDHIVRHWNRMATRAWRRRVGEEAYVSTESVECVTFAQLCARTGIETFDIIVIDAEGYDAEILRMIDLESCGVQALVLEHKHLGRADKKYCYRTLKAAGFRLGGSSKDLWGVRTIAAG